MYGQQLTVPGFPDLDQPLTDGVVVVRMSAERDIPEVLIAYEDDPGLAGGLGERRPPSGAELGRRAERAQADRREGVRLTLTIAQVHDDDCCGEVRLSPQGDAARLLVWIARGVRGRGLAQRAVGLVQEWLDRECGLDARCE